jgi:hypothetical protein
MVTPQDAPVYARTSGWAIAGLFFSAALCCPLMTLIGPLLGLRALIQIRADPQRIAGVGLARAAIVLGLLATVAQAGSLWWWQNHARSRMLQGPATEIRAGKLDLSKSFCCELTSLPYRDESPWKKASNSALEAADASPSNPERTASQSPRSPARISVAGPCSILERA